MQQEQQQKLLMTTWVDCVSYLVGEEPEWSKINFRIKRKVQTDKT